MVRQLLSQFVSACSLIRERVRAHLELHQLGFCAFASFHVKWRAG